MVQILLRSKLKPKSSRSGFEGADQLALVLGRKKEPGSGGKRGSKVSPPTGESGIVS